jgi:Right handed beta helix region
MKSVQVVLFSLICLVLSQTSAPAQHTLWTSPQGSGDFSGSDSLNAFGGLQSTLAYIINSGELPPESRVTINVMPGTYHMNDDSTLSIIGYDLPYIIFNGVGDERPHITGLAPEPITGWTQLGGNVWEAAWPHDFGYFMELDSFECGGDGYEGWIGCLIEDWVPNEATGQWRDGRTILRREMLYQGDNRLTQVGQPNVVWWRENSFAVPMEGSGTVRINVPHDPNEIPVHFSQSQYLIFARNCRGVELHNIEFSHGSPFIKSGMVDIALTPYARVSNCEFHNSNSYGLAIRKTPTTPIDPYDYDSWVLIEEARPPWNYIDRVYAHDNGIYGILVAHSQGMLLSNSRVEFNNWRGYEAGTVAYDAGGIKFFRTRHIEVDNYSGLRNYGHGLWFDKDGRDIVIRNSRFQYNHYRGLFIERCFGPALVDNVIASNNSQPLDNNDIYRFKSSAISLSACDSVLVQNSYISSTRGYPVLVHSIDYVMEDGILEPYGEEIYFQAKHNVFRNCVINKPIEPQFTFFTFGVSPQMSQCYYHYHTTFNSVQFQIGGNPIPKYMAIAEGFHNCSPIYFGFEYDLPKWYDTPWDDE